VLLHGKPGNHAKDTPPVGDEGSEALCEDETILWFSEDGFCAWWMARRKACFDLEREKGIRWMPWHQEAMKDVARCEKPRGAASRR